MYDLLLKDGKVVDPAPGIYDKRDIAITGGRIIALEKDIDPSQAKKVIPLNGKLVIPGLIDAHCHPSAQHATVKPDEIGLSSGVTLLCDGGSAGAANFDVIRDFTVSPASTDMYCFLNLATTGLVKTPEISAESDIDPEWTRRVAESNRALIKGIKIRAIDALAKGTGLKVIEVAKRLAADLKLPLMMHIGQPRGRTSSDFLDSFTRSAVKLLDRGDILSHFLTWGAGGLIMPDGEVFPELWAAHRRGVVLDSCHGLNNFSLKIAGHAVEQGLLPDIITSDLGTVSVPVVQSLLVTMSKFMALGLNLEQVVAMTTVNAARALGEAERRGSLKPGTPANVSILEMVKGDYLFSDGNGRGSLRGELLLEPHLVLKEGREVPCYSRYQLPPVYQEIRPS